MMSTAPRYPDVRIRLRSRNPYALVSAVRQGLRLSSVEAAEIARFTEEAMTQDDAGSVHRVCQAWARLDLTET